MITLKIFNPDQTPYWTCYFNTIEEKDAWLAEEETRPYWNPEFTLQVLDNTAQEQAQIEADRAAAAQAEEAQQARIAQLNTLKGKNPLTADDMQLIVSLMIEQLGNQ